MDRFSETRIEKKENGRKVYSISLTDNFEKNTKILTNYTPRLNERLDNIAFKFYGDSSKWYVIARANKHVKGTLFPPTGKSLIIPRID